jgi:two-component system response regulator YesN
MVIFENYPIQERRSTVRAARTETHFDKNPDEQYDIHPHIQHSDIQNLLILYTTFTKHAAEFITEQTAETDTVTLSSRRTKYCSLLHSTQEGEARCCQQMLKAGKQALDLGEPYIYVCHAGLVEWAVPVLCKGQYQGAIVSGGVLMCEPDADAIEEIVNRTRKLEIDRQKLKQAVKQIPIISAERVQAAAQLLFQMTCYTIGADALLLQKQRKLWQKRGVLAEAISQRKVSQMRDLNFCASETTAEKTVEKEPVDYHPLKRTDQTLSSTPLSMQHERKLVGYIRLGEREKVKKFLNHVLGGIFLDRGNDLAMIKIRLLELLTGMCRVGLQAGAPAERITEQYFMAVNDLQQAVDDDVIYSWTMDIFDRMMDEIYISRDNAEYNSVRQVIEYLQQHYNEDLTLDDVARKVHISPSHLSRLFKDELGMTIIDYLTDIRIAAAKQMLENSDLMVKEIAEKVGYQEASYFTRVFKKNTGVSPAEYRRLWGCSKYKKR